MTWGSGGRKVGGILPSLGSATVINVHEAVLNCVTLVTSLLHYYVVNTYPIVASPAINGCFATLRGE